jgi:hypothetical protein
MKNALLMTFALCFSATFVLPSIAQHAAKKTNAQPKVSGVYREKLSGDTLEVREVKGDKIYFHLTAYYPCINPPSEEFPGGPNMGEAEGTVPLKNHIAVYTTSEFGGKCRISMLFKNGQVTVTQDEPEVGCCGFGMNVEASGTYLKKAPISRKRPK